MSVKECNELFLHHSHNLGVGLDAAFLLSLINNGSELLKYSRENLGSEFSDDLDVACRLFTFYKTEKEFDESVEESTLELFDRLFEEAKAKVLAMNVLRNNIYRVGSNFTSFNDFRRHYQIYNVRDELPPVQPASTFGCVHSALALALFQAFWPQNTLLFFNDSSTKQTIFNSKTYKKRVYINKNSVVPNSYIFRLHKYGRAITTKLRTDENGNLWTSFVCLVPHAYRCMNLSEEIDTFELELGSSRVEDLLNECGGGGDDFTRITEEFAFANDYRPGDFSLSLVCTKKAYRDLLNYSNKNLQRVVENEIDWNILRCRFAEYGALVNFGPGLKIRSVETEYENFADFTICIYTNKKETPSEQQSTFFFSLENLFTSFCVSQFGYKPLIFIYDDNFYITLKSQKDEEKVIMKFTMNITRIAQGNGFRAIKDGMLEYLLSTDLRDFGTENDQNSNFPPSTREKCTICLSSLEGTTNCIKLSFCAHFYCDSCLLNLIRNNRCLPIHCAQPNCQPLSIRDMRKVFSRNFSSLKALRDFLLPLTSHALSTFISNTDEISWCRTVDCRRLIKTNKKCPTITCLKCEKKRCGGCGDDVHEGMSCEETQQKRLLSDQPMLQKWKEDLPERRRFCPNQNCKMMIERTLEGCNHMQCSSCKIHFCWLCENITADNCREIYKHMLGVHGSYGVDFDEWNLRNRPSVELTDYYHYDCDEHEVLPIESSQTLVEAFRQFERIYMTMPLEESCF